MKKERILSIVGLVILYVCLVTEIILIVIDFSLPHLIYAIGLFVFTVSNHFILFIINRINRETKKELKIERPFIYEVKWAVHENLREFTKWLTKRSNNYFYEALLAEYESENWIKLPETKKEIISEIGGVIKEFTRDNVSAETVDGFVEVNKFIEDYINEL